jgi:hypothetical protein
MRALSPVRSHLIFLLFKGTKIDVLPCLPKDRCLTAWYIRLGTNWMRAFRSWGDVHFDAPRPRPGDDKTGRVPHQMPSPRGL